MSRERFDELVSDALDLVPPDLADIMDNVVILVEDISPDRNPHLLGLYEGVPLTARGDTYSARLPDRITIFRWPILRRCRTEAQVIEQVEITVVHEIAHHFGIGDERLHELGYG